MKNQLSIGQCKKEIEKKLESGIIILEQKFGLHIPMPKLDFTSLTGTTGGMANARDNTIYINNQLMNANWEDYINQTIPHELSHIFARKKFGAGIDPHGLHWKVVIQTLGGKPERCHKYDTTFAKMARNINNENKQSSSIKYCCMCEGGKREHKMTVQQSLQMLKGAKFTCKKCKCALRKVS